jgi:hypothetical protein
MPKPVSPVDIKFTLPLDVGPLVEVINKSLTKTLWTPVEQKEGRTVDLGRTALSSEEIDLLLQQYRETGWAVCWIAKTHVFLFKSLPAKTGTSPTPTEKIDTQIVDLGLNLPESLQVWVQEWEETERGWGCKPDGWTISPTKEAAVKHTEQLSKDMRAREKEIYKGEVPECYSRPDGTPYEIELRNPELITRALDAFPQALGIWAGTDSPPKQPSKTIVL